MSATETAKGLHRLYLKDGSKILVGTHGDEIEVGSDTTGTFTSSLDLATADHRWQFVTWHNLIIGGDGYNQPIKGDGTDFTYLGSLFGEDKGSGTGPVAGTYSYKVSFYTSSYDVIFDVISAPVVNGAGDHDIDLSMIPIGPDTFLGEDITGRKIYRNKLAAQTTWYLLSNGTIANNTATILTDSDTDAELGATEYDASVDATWTPPKGRFCIVSNNRLMFANDPTTATDTGPSTIYYSKSGSHDLFESADNYFNVRRNDGDEITFVKNLLGILTVGKTGTIQKMYTDGDDPANDWEISDPFSPAVGCVAPYSAKNTPLGIEFLAWGGLYVFNGQNSKLVSDIITPTINNISLSNFKNAWGEYHQNAYYLAYAAFPSSDNNRVLRHDLLTNSFSIDIIDINCFTVFGGSDDWGDLYAGSSTTGEVYTYRRGSTLGVSHSSYTDFAGTWDDMGYFQPIEGGNPEQAILEIRENDDLDDMAGTIDNGTGDVDRPDTSGTYVSRVMQMPGITAYATLQWNETIPSGDVIFQLRGGTTEARCIAGDDSAFGDGASLTTPSGSNISGEIGGTAYEFTQYKITMSTDDIDESPTVYFGNFTIKLFYDILAADLETTIPLEWEGGWTNFKHDGYKLTLRKLYVLHNGTSGDLVLTFTAFEGHQDTFTIDLANNTKYYTEYFSEGAITSEYFKLNIQNSDLYALDIDKIYVMYDIEPLI